MKRALKVYEGKIQVHLKIKRNELEIYKSWGKEKPTEFWEFLDKNALSIALNAPKELSYLLNIEQKLNNREKVIQSYFKHLLSSNKLYLTKGMPHNINTPWLSPTDNLKFLYLTGMISPIITVNKSNFHINHSSDIDKIFQKY